MNTLFKALVIGMSFTGFSIVGLPAIAADAEPPAPATEHQSDVLDNEKGAEAEGGTRKGATGDRENMGEGNLPATEHQEKALKGDQGSEDDSSKKMMEEPDVPR